MNDNEKLYLEWLEKQKAGGVKSVTYSTTDGDNFPQFNLEELFGKAVDMAVADGRAKPLVFNDKTTKK